MKKRIVILIIVGAILSAGLVAVFGAFDGKATEGGHLTLNLRAGKDTYFLGEAIDLTLELQNDGDQEIKSGTCFDVASGNQRILISSDGVSYKEYSHSKWGVSDKKCGVISLKPKESVTNTVTLLWNFVPKVANLDKISDKQLITNYAFPVAGTYYIKATSLVNNAGPLMEISSLPVKLIIQEPTGESLAVWNLIKDRPDLGYFIQERDFNTYDPELRAKLEKEIELLITNYPNSLYSQRLQQNLVELQKNRKKK